MLKNMFFGESGYQERAISFQFLIFICVIIKFGYCQYPKIGIDNNLLEHLTILLSTLVLF